MFGLLHELERFVAAACDAASARLDGQLAVASSLAPERRLAALGCIECHLHEARAAVECAADPDERAEYEWTCERLRDVRQLI